MEQDPNDYFTKRTFKIASRSSSLAMAQTYEVYLLFSIFIPIKNFFLIHKISLKIKKN